jgi:hypothetical protein
MVCYNILKVPAILENGCLAIYCICLYNLTIDRMFNRLIKYLLPLICVFSSFFPSFGFPFLEDIKMINPFLNCQAQAEKNNSGYT